MRNQQGVLGIFPVFSMVILGVGLMNHVMVLPPLLQVAGRDAWISTIVPYLLWIWLLYAVMKITRQQYIFDWLQNACGAWVSTAFKIVFIFYAFAIFTTTQQETVMWTHVSFLPQTPRLVLALALMLLCYRAAFHGLRAIAVTTGILLPIVIVFGDFVMSANMPQKNYSLLWPILENGWLPPVKGCLVLLGGLSEILLLLLIQHTLKKRLTLWSLWLLGIFLVVLIIGPAIGAITEFGPVEAARMRYPAYEEWRLVVMGRYIRHLDFLSIYQWLSGAFVRISMSMYFIAELIVGPGKPRRRHACLLILFALNVAIAALHISDEQYYFFLSHVYLPGSFLLSTGVLLILFILAVIYGRKENKANGYRDSGTATNMDAPANPGPVPQ